MPSRMSDGSYAHVTGTFDLEQKTGTIDYMTPVKVAIKTIEFTEEKITISGMERRNK